MGKEMGEEKGKECSEWVLKVTHETHFRGEAKQTSNSEGSGSHRHEWQRAPWVSLECWPRASLKSGAEMGLCQRGRHLTLPRPALRASSLLSVLRTKVQRGKLSLKVSTSPSSLEKSAELSAREGPLLSLAGSDISWSMLCVPLLSWVASILASLRLAVTWHWLYSRHPQAACLAYVLAHWYYGFFSPGFTGERGQQNQGPNWPHSEDPRCVLGLITRTQDGLGGWIEAQRAHSNASVLSTCPEEYVHPVCSGTRSP